MKIINIKNINPIDYITIDLSEFTRKEDKEIKAIIETVEEDDRTLTPLEAEIQLRFLKELKQYLKRRQERRRNFKKVRKVLGARDK